MGRPLIGKRASCFLSKETHQWLKESRNSLGIKTKAELMRLIIEWAKENPHIIDILKLKRKIITEEEFRERVPECALA